MFKVPHCCKKGNIYIYSVFVYFNIRFINCVNLKSMQILSNIFFNWGLTAYVLPQMLSFFFQFISEIICVKYVKLLQPICPCFFCVRKQRIQSLCNLRYFKVSFILVKA